MTDTTTCPSCSAAVPVGAAFCTSCGHRMAEAAAPAADTPPPADATFVDTPGLHDSTQVLPPAPAAPAAPEAPAWEAPAAPAAPAAPWEPAPTGAPAPPAPAAPAPGWGEAPAAPAWGEVAAPAPTEVPAWQQPPAAAAGQPPAWGQPAPGAQPPAWGAPAPTPSPSSDGPGSPLGGLATLVGGVLALVGTFSGWVTLKKNSSGIAGDATISLWSFASGDEVIKSNDPYLLVAFGVLAIVVGVLLFTGKARPIARIAAVGAGIAIIAVSALDWSSISSLVSDEAAFQATGGGKGATAKTAIGFYLAIAGGIVAAVGAVLPAKKA